MARLASEAKMGYYPTPDESLYYIRQNMDFGDEEHHLLDPCCGEGEAIKSLVAIFNNATSWGIELDAERANKSAESLNNVIQCSIYDARINPLGCMGLLFLNPPYSIEEGERTEMKFLRHSMKWLCVGGLLVFIVPEHIFGDKRNRQWIAEYFENISAMRLCRNDFPAFKQVVLFGTKRAKRTEAEPIPPPPYPHIEDVSISPYIVPSTRGAQVFQTGLSITDEDMLKNQPRVFEELAKIVGHESDLKHLSPVMLLRKGHIVSLIAGGFLDGKVFTSKEDFIVIKGFSRRVKNTYVDDNKEITRDTYSIGIRVIERSKWYDIY